MARRNLKLDDRTEQMVAEIIEAEGGSGNLTEVVKRGVRELYQTLQPFLVKARFVEVERAKAE